jgi:predicted component of type VI protein secretion system
MLRTLRNVTMAKLILSMEGSVIREVPLDKERLTIGRKPQNDIQIENLAVSGEHACIVTILNDSFLEDLGSTNGTLVNGNPIKRHILRNNDVIEIGKYKLKYMTDTVGSSPVHESKQTVVLPSAAAGKATAAPLATGAAQEVAAGAATAAVKSAESQPLAAIQILSGPNAGEEHELVKNLTTLGKPGVQVAVIARRAQGYFITHVEGAAFPTVNGKALDAQPRPLSDHDVIELAGVKMEFFIKSQ